jgi:hypothetical protein
MAVESFVTHYRLRLQQRVGAIRLAQGSDMNICFGLGMPSRFKVDPSLAVVFEEKRTV